MGANSFERNRLRRWRIKLILVCRGRLSGAILGPRSRPSLRISAEQFTSSCSLPVLSAPPAHLISSLHASPRALPLHLRRRNLPPPLHRHHHLLVPKRSPLRPPHLAQPH